MFRDLDMDILRMTIQESIYLRISSIAPEGKNTADIMPFLNFLFKFYDNIAPECFSGKFKCAIYEIDYEVDSVKRKTVMEVCRDYNCDGTHAIVLIDENYCALVPSELINPEEGNIVYEFENGIEKIIWNGKKIDLPPRAMPSALSHFSHPTFKGLDNALIEYGRTLARCSNDGYLRTIWADDHRTRFKGAPEHYMRDSLHIFLKSVLRGNPDITRELIVDAQRPVDIAVSWTRPIVTALIEIKWLGVSIDRKTNERTAQYGKWRAHEGAKQLQDYWLLYHNDNSDTYCEGYNVVFDGRRRNQGNVEKELSSQEMWHYENDEIEYTEDLLQYEQLRNNYRYFMEPNCLKGA